MGTKKKKKEIVLHLHSFIVVVIMSSSPSTTTTHTTTTKVFASSSPVVKTVLFGVLASTVIASFAVFASENAHILVQQTVSKDALVQGENVTVSVTATNAGLANARNVVIKAPLHRNGGKWLQVNEESLEQKLSNLDVGETKEMTYVYNVKDAGTYVVEPVTIQYFASETREVTKGESNVVKNVKVLTPMQNNVRKALSDWLFLAGRVEYRGGLVTVFQVDCWDDRVAFGELGCVENKIRGTIAETNGRRERFR